MKRFALISLTLILLVVPMVARAADECDPGKILPPCTCTGNCQLSDFVQLFVNLYAFGVHIAAPLAIFFLIVGSVILVTASGYSNRIEMGKTIITQAVTGLVIVLVSWVIIDTAIFVITGNLDRSVFGKPWFGGFTYTCDDSLLYQGCTGANVGNLQRALRSLGYNVTVDRDYGLETTAAVTQFQSDANTVYVAIAQNACGGRTGGTEVWGWVFNKTCPTDCTVPEQTAQDLRLIVNGNATTKTLQALKNFQGVAEQFTLACKT